MGETQGLPEHGDTGWVDTTGDCRWTSVEGLTGPRISLRGGSASGEGTVLALALGHDRLLGTGESWLWGLWAPRRPETTSSQSQTSQMPLDVAKVVRTKWGPQGRLIQPWRPKGKGAGREGTGWFPPERVSLVQSGS